MREQLFDNLSNAIAVGEVEEAVRIVREAISAGIPPLEVLDKGGTRGLEVVSERFSDGTAFLPELIMAGDAMTEILNIVLEELGDEATTERLGKIVIGQVKGDLHDIGKNVVSALLSVNGFEVFDLGIDVDVKEFVDKAEEVGANIIASSTLLTTSMPYQEDILTYLKDMGSREKYYCIVGGGPVTAEWAEQIGADGYGRNAADAVKLCKKIMKAGKPPLGNLEIVDCSEV